MQLFDTVKTLFTYPLKALFSINFYFEVLFKMRGIGFLYLLFLSLLAAVPVSYRANDVVQTLKAANFPAMILQIPSCYLNENGILSVADDNYAYKEIVSQNGNVSIVFNVEDRPSVSFNTPMAVELNSDRFVLSVYGQKIAQRYTDSFKSGSNFSPIEQSEVAAMALNFAVYINYPVVVFLLCIKLIFLSFVSAVITKFIFVVLGKMKTGFSNVWRLNIFASSSVALAMTIQAIFRLQLSDIILLLMPLAYMVAFIKSFRSELESGSIEDFVHKYAPHGTRVRKSEANEPKDVSEYTEGLNSTSNQNREESCLSDDDLSDDEKSQENGNDSNNKNKNHPGSFSA